MIDEDTPDKLAEIIRMTWPGLFMRPEKHDQPKSDEEKRNDTI